MDDRPNGDESCRSYLAITRATQLREDWRRRLIQWLRCSDLTRFRIRWHSTSFRGLWWHVVLSGDSSRTLAEARRQRRRRRRSFESRDLPRKPPLRPLCRDRRYRVVVKNEAPLRRVVSGLGFGKKFETPCKSDPQRPPATSDRNPMFANMTATAHKTAAD